MDWHSKSGLLRVQKDKIAKKRNSQLLRVDCPLEIIGSYGGDFKKYVVFRLDFNSQSSRGWRTKIKEK